MLRSQRIEKVLRWTDGGDTFPIVKKYIWWSLAFLGASGLVTVHHEPHWSLAFLVFGWPGGVTVWALFITMVAIAEQSYFTRIAAKAAQDSAAASANQAEYMVASERPFIMVETRGTHGTEFWMKNCGRSPAEIFFLAPLL